MLTHQINFPNFFSEIFGVFLEKNSIFETTSIINLFQCKQIFITTHNVNCVWLLMFEKYILPSSMQYILTLYFFVSFFYFGWQNSSNRSKIYKYPNKLCKISQNNTKNLFQWFCRQSYKNQQKNCFYFVIFVCF